MSLVVTLKFGMPGYKEHCLDFMVSNYTGEYGYRKITLADVEFARYIYINTGVHIDLGSRREASKGQAGAISSVYNIVDENGEPTMQELHLNAPPSKYRQYAIYTDKDPFEPNHLILLIKPRRNTKETDTEAKFAEHTVTKELLVVNKALGLNGAFKETN